MYTKEVLERIIIDQSKDYKLPNNYIKRNLEEKILNSNFSDISIITGIRRVGKSSLLLSLKQNLGGNYYINFDDERLADFTIQDFQTLYEVFLELYGNQDYFYFDEIQNIPEWERFIRRLHDTGKKVILTGSNASLLSKELGTRLTGRYLAYTLFPFSFREFLAYKNYNSKKPFSTEDRVMLLKLFKEYISVGGIPKYVLEGNKEYLRNLYESILFRDIVARFQVTQIRALRSLSKYLISNFARLFSLRQLTTVAHIKSVSTVSNYLEYLADTYLIFYVSKYSYTLKDSLNAPRKLYVIDLGLVDVIGFSFSQNIGARLENTVFLELKSRNIGEIYYYKDSELEVDFLLQNGFEIVQAIQVTAYLNSNNRQRELNGLVYALDKFKAKNGFIITLDQKDTINYKGHNIKVIPIYEWLLEDGR